MFPACLRPSKNELLHTTSSWQQYGPYHSLETVGKISNYNPLVLQCLKTSSQPDRGFFLSAISAWNYSSLNPTLPVVKAWSSKSLTPCHSPLIRTIKHHYITCFMYCRWNEQHYTHIKTLQRNSTINSSSYEKSKFPAFHLYKLVTFQGGRLVLGNNKSYFLVKQIHKVYFYFHQPLVEHVALPSPTTE